MALKYVTGDLFQAPKEQLLVHACNCQGVWGSGIAVTFRKFFTNEYNLYKTFCENNDDIARLPGQSLILNRVGCLFTSFNYGNLVDPSCMILNQTKLSLIDLFCKTTMDIAMPKINSGLFKVPWEDTEKIIKELAEEFNRDIYVYELEKK